MNNASILFINILVMLFYSLPGFVLVKSKMLKTETISGFNILLLYVAQPCLSYYALTKIDFETRILINMLYTFAIAFGIMLGVIGIFYLFTKKRQKENSELRLSNLCIAFGNCTFMGLPLLEALLPQYLEASVYSIVFFISMAVIGWTVGCFLITHDKKYISIKKILFNPAMVGLALSLPFFLLNISIPSTFHSALTLMGKMSTPLCMLILGMRLATLPIKSVFADKNKYITIFFRQLIVPLVYVLICSILPIEPNLKLTLVVCGSAPVAAVILNYAELLGQGREYSAAIIVLSSILSVITMPLIILLI